MLLSEVSGETSTYIFQFSLYWCAPSELLDGWKGWCFSFTSNSAMKPVRKRDLILFGCWFYLETRSRLWVQSGSSEQILRGEEINGK